MSIEDIEVGEGYEPRAYDAGNVNATRLGAADFCAWYTGTQSNAAVVVTCVNAVPTSVAPATR